MRRQKRDRYNGRFIQDRTIYAFFMIPVLVISFSLLGVNTILNWVKSIEKTFIVENTQAEETITNEDLVEARIAKLINVVYQKAKVYGVSGYQMERTIECESRFNNIQSTAYKNGVREDSWGIAQIHLPSHSEVSRLEAMNEEFAIEWMAQNFNNPYVTWYAYSRKYDRCN